MRRAVVLVILVLSMTLAPSAAQAAPAHRSVTAHSASFWQVVKCGVAVGVFIAGNGLLITKVRKLGGIRKVARRILRAKGAERKWEAVLGMFGYVSGVGTLVEGCT